MPKITFVQPDGSHQTLEFGIGESLMRYSVDADVGGILAECGGACACATCQVIIDPAWRDKLPAPEMMEESMLDEDDEEGRRLSCQIVVTEELDGLVVKIPSSQH